MRTRATLWIWIFLVTLAAWGSVATAGIRTAGDQRWVSVFEGGGHVSVGQVVAVSPDESTIYAAGTIASTSGQWVVIAYEAGAGTPKWKATLKSRSTGPAQPSAIATSPDGTTVFVTGWLIDSSNHEIIATVAYDAATGVRQWIARYSGPFLSDSPQGLAVSPDGSSVFVVGTDANAFSQQMVTLAFDAATGAKQWVSLYAGPENLTTGAALALSSDGQRLYSLGTSDDGLPTFTDFAVVGYETATGAVTWATRVNGGPGLPDHAKAIGVSTDQRLVIIAGSTGLVGAGSDYYTAALDATTGSMSWNERYDGASHQDDTVSGLAVGPDGFSVYVTGSARELSPSNSDYVTVGYAQSTGARDYTATYAGAAGNNDTAVGLVASPDGSVIYVTGTEGLSPFGSEYATVAFDSTTGQTLWVGAYQGPLAEDWPLAIAVGPTTGSVVVVTGESYIAPAQAAMATVAYDAT